MSNNVVFVTGKEMYHFAQLREEVGDLPLIGMLAERQMRINHCSATSAVRAAADQFELLDELQAGKAVFSQMRSAQGLGRIKAVQNLVATDLSQVGSNEH
ncbi:hypothetical protein [Halopseudomonas bauzanensis]|uniref:Uncharacterized protein n=1 Tax=Halopseudomonas bauzanensis TaxID=653930 RepID=A0A1H9SJX3_9GAMM|nr:hypothetical protein [Halopseudomonas bauzanensis]SER85198.1 hypothetical protein SAMN05216589_1567 [Halopseudomonas bauzanensis]SFL95078.1 hypothetical protein SAMN04487855_1746 [Halopseudomonas bauzanensis]